ncbi:DUF1295 domain-containing protein [Aeoliella sp. SH292]|uniref:DUF1295 domain-containing protein n=1 Tax=Aeoliella sp. SH292 TaxID=3454464 RepID=UPI003F9E1058
MSISALLLLAAFSISVYMLTFWLVSTVIQNVSIVDIGWGAGFVLVAWIAYFAAPADGLRATVLLVLVTVWGFRLAGYLAWRNIGKPEDHRYAAMRKKHGERFCWVSLFTVFALQGVIMWIVALPVTIGMGHSEFLKSLSAWHLVGLMVWTIGLVFEAGGDWQLAKFKANPANKGKVCDRGFWRYTRHPNYFGDCCVWWGLWMVSLATWSDAWTAISPVLMTVLLLQFSGVRLLEYDIADRRPDYAEYKRRTSAFIPWPPKSA